MSNSGRKSFCTVKVKHSKWSNNKRNTSSATVYTATHSAAFSPEVTLAAAIATLTNILASRCCSTLSILCYSNKHIHAEVVSHPAPIQHLCGSSVLLCGWFTQPLTGGSLWTSEHIRRQTQEPSALIMSDHSVHGHEIHFLLSLSLSLAVSFSFTLSDSHRHTHTHFTHLHSCLHNTPTTYQEKTHQNIWGLLGYRSHRFMRVILMSKLCAMRTCN